MKNLVVGKIYYTPNYGGVAKMELMEIIDYHTALLRNKTGCVNICLTDCKN